MISNMKHRPTLGAGNARVGSEVLDNGPVR